MPQKRFRNLINPKRHPNKNNKSNRIASIVTKSHNLSANNDLTKKHLIPNYYLMNTWTYRQNRNQLNWLTAYCSTGKIKVESTLNENKDLI